MNMLFEKQEKDEQSHLFFSHVIDKPLHYKIGSHRRESRQIICEIHLPQKEVKVLHPLINNIDEDGSLLDSPDIDFETRLWEYIVAYINKNHIIPRKLIIHRKTGEGWKEAFQEKKTERHEFEFQDIEDMLRTQFKQRVRSSLNILMNLPENPFGKILTHEIPLVLLCRFYSLQEANKDILSLFLDEILPAIGKSRKKNSQQEFAKKVENLL